MSQPTRLFSAARQLAILLLLAILTVGSLSASLEAQTTTVVRDTEAIEHVGQYVTIEGTVAVVFASKNGNTFLNFGDRYPNQIFTGWIPKDSALAGDPSLSSLEGKTVKITGKIDLYQGKPEIKIMSHDQLLAE